MAASWKSLENILRPFDTRVHPLPVEIAPELRRASVLIPLFWKNDEWRVLLTIRASKLRTHSGLVAFPGGRKEDTDENEIATALRESEEEVGLNPKDAQVMAVFPPSFVTSNTLVTPVAAVIPNNFVPRVNPDEVEKVFDLPLARFLKEDYKLKTNPQPGGYICIYHFKDDINGEVIETWGYTAMVLIRVAMVIFQSDVRRELTQGFFLTKDNALSPVSQANTLKTLWQKTKEGGKL